MHSIRPLCLSQNLIYSICRAPFSTARKSFRSDRYKKVDAPEVECADFQSLLRSLYKKSHPDLLRSSFPEQADTNDQSMQLLNGILTTIKQYNAYPPRTKRSLPFFVRGEGGLNRIDLHVSTAGGDCKRQLTESFEDFFARCALLEKGKKFVWNPDYFPITAREGQNETNT